MDGLGRLLRPRSIAVIGGGAWCANVVAQCRRTGFAGDIWPVHPKRAEVAGLPAVARLADLPGVPDAAFVGVNRAATVPVVAALAAMGAGGAVCFASGFREALAELADGGDLQDELVAAAGTMPFLGPNCYGFINALDGAALWPDQHGLAPVARGVALVTQSSNIAINLTMQRRGLPVAYVVTAGNQAQTGLAQIGAALLADPRVTALGLHIEGIGDVPAFEALAAAARAAGKPIVALKVGTSDQARAATVSHTASLAGSDAGARALLARLGVAQVESLSIMLETLKLLHVTGPLPSARVGSLSCSGGEASLMADAGQAAGVSFPPLGAAQRTTLRDVLGPKVALANPLDYHTYIWNDRAAMGACFRAMMAPELALGCVVLDFPRNDRCSAADWQAAVDAIADARCAGRMAMIASLPENMPESVAVDAIARGIVPLCGMAEALAAIAAAAWLGQPRQPSPALHPVGPPPVAPVLIPEAEAKAALAAHGLRIPRAARARNGTAAVRAAAAIGFPVALKAEGVAHKTEAGAVALGLASVAQVRAAAARMAGSGYLVEEMVDGAVAELLIGVTRDPAHGWLLTIAAGGVQTEIWHDSQSLLLPAPDADILAALSRLRMAPLLDGWRGAAAADRGAILAAIRAVASYAAATPGLAEVEVNPLICRAADAVAVDALIRKEPS